MSSLTRALGLLLSSAPLLVVACGDGDIVPDSGTSFVDGSVTARDGDVEPEPDAEEPDEPDASEDEDADTSEPADAASDAEPELDAGEDASEQPDAGEAADASADAAPDAGLDAAPEAGGDAAADAAPDASGDAGSDAGSDASPDASDATTPITFSTTPTQPLCRGDTTGSISFDDVSGGAGGYTYSVNGVDYQTSNTFDDLPAGSYALAVKDSAGQVKTASLTLGEPAALAITDSSSTDVSLFCDGVRYGTATVTVGGGTAPYTYAWSPNEDIVGDGTSSVSGLAGSPAGVTYTVTVSDTNGCSLDPESFTIVDNTAAIVEEQAAYCFNAGLFDYYDLEAPASFRDCFDHDASVAYNQFFNGWADAVSQSTVSSVVADTNAYFAGAGQTLYETDLLEARDCFIATEANIALTDAAGIDLYDSDFMLAMLSYIATNYVAYRSDFLAIDGALDDEKPFTAGQLYGEFSEDILSE